ncbi:hypothetical protein COS81_04075 [candidate division WWE3 bacterium CG06_land_8_20_14_3_00_42_16]|uniref:FCP1 homology domain-containing protein n=2 Tax=Katanobacteria TaxID=422282 RepID=A0A2M7AM06_UNCKA|nr:MAG: hypothetical protein COS81_04075 [candidate division WWE3 bacterium CG06_land_8_20_14_3_00_42_16]PJC68408.1 MAG: hypothetical protein CO015_04105 [candidate division WWE3 bacterium CG_4_8_14_3_um_filter_42_11]
MFCGCYIIKLTFLPSFHQENKPIPYSLETLSRLRQAGHKIFFVSCRQTAIKHHTLDWLKKYGFWEIASGVLHRDEWKLHLDFKREITQKLKLDFFIDDSLDHARYIASSTTTVFLLKKPWNQNDALPHFVRVKNWPAILNYFKRLVEHANKPLHPLKLSQLLKPHDTRFYR